MNFYVFNKESKVYYAGIFWGMPTWSPLKSKAVTFDCPIEASNFARGWGSNLIVTD